MTFIYVSREKVAKGPKEEQYAKLAEERITNNMERAHQQWYNLFTFVRIDLRSADICMDDHRCLMERKRRGGIELRC